MLGEFLGDLVVYRNLIPVDKRLPSMNAIRSEINLSTSNVPRKTEPDYALIVTHLLTRARALDHSTAQIQRLIAIGDTQMNDGIAFGNICAAGGWTGLAFIGSETSDAPQVEIIDTYRGGQLYLSNRWASLPDFDRFCTEHGAHIDEATAVIIDLDKTALGARGRNAHVIDQVRIRAMRDTMSGFLGTAFDHATFQSAYDQLNQVEFHPFTGDNQDCLAYVCLIIGSGLYELSSVVAEVRSQSLTCFREFIDQVDGRSRDLPPGLDSVHSEIYANVQKGDPTPFKTFRFHEYLGTVGRMGKLGEDATVEALLAEEILITEEVRELALDWQERGALLFGLSDKPDEASVPGPELVAQGYLPIHRVATWSVGDTKREE